MPKRIRQDAVSEIVWPRSGTVEAWGKPSPRAVKLQANQADKKPERFCQYMNFPAEIFRTRNSVRMPVAVLLACFFSYVARHRFVDGDEGFYLLASRLVLNHKTPYLDFFYTQAPLLPYVYGLWMKLFGISWFSARTLSSVLTAMVGMLIYEHICRETGKLAAGMAAIVLFASSVLVFGWFPIVQTYSLATLFLFGAYVTVARLSSTQW